MSTSIDRVAQAYDPEALIAFFEGIGHFDPDASSFAGEFDQGEVLGTLVLEDGLEVPLFSVLVKDAVQKQQEAPSRKSLVL